VGGFFGNGVHGYLRLVRGSKDSHTNQPGAVVERAAPSLAVFDYGWTRSRTVAAPLGGQYKSVIVAGDDI